MRVSTNDGNVFTISNWNKMKTLVNISKDVGEDEIVPLPFINSWQLNLVLENRIEENVFESLIVCNYLEYTEPIDEIIYTFQISKISEKYQKFLKPFYLKIFSSFENVEDAREFRKGKDLPEIYQDVNSNWSLDLFAKLGNVEIVKLLLKYRTFEDYKEPARLAALEGHLKVYKLIAKDTDIFPSGYANFLLFKTELYPFDFNQHSIKMACIYGSLKFFKDHEDAIKSYPYDVIAGAIHYKQVKILKYLMNITNQKENIMKYIMQKDFDLFKQLYKPDEKEFYVDNLHFFSFWDSLKFQYHFDKGPFLIIFGFAMCFIMFIQLMIINS